MDLATEVGKQISRPADSDPRPDGAVTKVGRAAGQASLQVFEALFKAGDRLVTELCDETAAVVSHRYGQEAGDVARDALDVGRDVKTLADTLIPARAMSRLTMKASMYTTRGLVEGRTGDFRPGDDSNNNTNKKSSNGKGAALQ